MPYARLAAPSCSLLAFVAVACGGSPKPPAPVEAAQLMRSAEPPPDSLPVAQAPADAPLPPIEIIPVDPPEEQAAPALKRPEAGAAAAGGPDPNSLERTCLWISTVLGRPRDPKDNAIKTQRYWADVRKQWASLGGKRVRWAGVVQEVAPSGDKTQGVVTFLDAAAAIKHMHAQAKKAPVAANKAVLDQIIAEGRIVPPSRVARASVNPLTSPGRELFTTLQLPAISIPIEEAENLYRGQLVRFEATVRGTKQGGTSFLLLGFVDAKIISVEPPLDPPTPVRRRKSD